MEPIIVLIYLNVTHFTWSIVSNLYDQIKLNNELTELKKLIQTSK